MRIRTIIRVTPGAWMTPMMVILALWYVQQSILPGREPYALGLTSRAMNALGLITPFCAAAGAWEGARIRRSRVWDLAPARRTIFAAAWLIAPAVVGGMVAFLASVELVLVREGLWFPHPVPLLVALSVMVAQVTAGLGVGLILPRLVAVPTVAMVSFLSFVIPRLVPIGWPRHLNGTSIELCCPSTEVLAPSVVMASVMFSAGILVCGLVLISQRDRERRTISRAIAPIVVAAVIGAGLTARHPSPADPRMDRATVCATSDDVEVCAWPDHAGQVDRAAVLATQATRRWRAIGIQTPTVFREGAIRPGEDAVPITLTGRLLDDRELESTLASGMVPTPPPCAADGPYPAAVAYPFLMLWFSTVIDPSRSMLEQMPMDEIPSEDIYPDAPSSAMIPIRSLVESILSEPTSDQVAWVERNRTSMRGCDTNAPLDP
jgi:hypothetical protein